jgi:ABC-2 type transport system ATP-binding protein
VIELVGLGSVADKRVGGFSLGMGQRLGVAAALLGDPSTVILDEPANGLDPEGIRWIRNLLKGLAAEGRTVFLSSHLMSEMEQTAEHLIVIGRGRLIADTDVATFVAQASAGAPVRVRAAEPTVLAAAIAAGGGRTETLDGGALQVFGLTSERVGEIAAAQQLVLHELTPMQVSLEDAFMDLTKDSVEYQHLENTAPDPSAVGAGA